MMPPNCSIPFFLKSQREILHLCLEGNPIPWERDGATKWNISYTGSLQFWQRFGPQLKSLSIRNCQLEYDELLQIVSHCTRLKLLELSDLEVKISQSERTCIKPRSVGIENVLGIISNRDAMFIEVKVRNKFSEFLECFRDGLFMAPNLDSFRVELVPVPDVQIQSLTIDEFNATELSLFRNSLRKLEISSPLFVDDGLKTIYTELRELRCLKLMLYESESGFPFHLLPKLTSLSLEFSDFPGDEIGAKFVDGLCSIEDSILEHFSLVGSCSPNTIVRFAKTHPSLLYLSLNVSDGLNDYSVQAIFKYLVSLESLVLSGRKITDVGLSGQTASHSEDTGYGISRLKNLWYLDLECCAGIRGAPFCSGLTLPLLRHFKVDASSFLEDALIAVVKNHPRIETLKLFYGIFTERLVETMVGNLYRLRYVFSLDDRGTSKECIKALGELCKLVEFQRCLEPEWFDDTEGGGEVEQFLRLLCYSKIKQLRKIRK